MSLFARLSLANRGLVALVAVVVTAFGAFAIPSLKQQLLPSLEFPAAFVVAPYPGAAPEIVEQRVTEPIENSVRGIAGLSKVTSTSREGSASIQVEFEFGTDLDDATNKLQTALSRVGPQLPDGVEPQVFAGSTDDLPAVVLFASNGEGGDPKELVDRLESTVVPDLEEIDGVRTVDIEGARDPVVAVTPDPAKMAAAGLDVRSISTALQANGVAIPAGALTADDKTRTIQVGTPITTIDQLRELWLAPGPGANPVQLGAVATVEPGLAPPTGFTRTNGQDSIGIAVTAAPDGNAVEISHEIRDRLADLGESSGATLTVIFDQAPFVEKSIDSLTTEGLLGLLMAVLVILVFLLSVRSTLVTAVSIPLSVLVALIALWIGDYSLNLLTLGALTIAVGRVVDDSIVVLENIKRHLGYGEDKRRAILDGVKEVAGAVTASTLTTVAVFAPIALVGGFVGQLFAPFAITVTVALLASLLVSLTVIPVLAYWFLRPATGAGDEASVRRAAEERERHSFLQLAYLPVIGFATRRRWATVGIGLAVLLGTFGLSTQLKTNFLDDSGQDTFVISQELPPGTSLDATDAAARRVEGVLAGRDDIESYQVTAGGGGAPWDGGGVTAASFSVTVKEGVDSGEVQDELRQQLGGINGAGEITVGGGGGPDGGSTDELEVIVQAADPDALAQATDQVRQAMTETPDVDQVSTSLSADVPRLDVVVDRATATRVGLTEQAIGQIVAQIMRGGPVGRVSIDGVQQDVVVTPAGSPATVEALRAHRIGTFRLDDVADIDEVAGPVEITRIDGERSATVTGTATGSNVGAVSAALTERLEGLDLPPGATYEIGGVSADQAEAFADLGLAVLAAIAIVFVIMVATFRSLVQPVILLVSIPFAATGAITLLLVTGTPLGVPALIGILMLVGIVVTNAIVLMDLVNQYRQQGMPVLEAVVEGGRRRLRPILMTAIATIFALLPMALGLTGEGGFISQPLAIVVIGGLISSTLLTLVLVPTLYTMVESFKERFRREPDLVFAGPRPSNGHEPLVAPPPAKPSAALIEGTDQFEVLRLPKIKKPMQ
ncbi:efflux RND transporter permease subunit [Phytohabitans sp. ZYX-F-186]|uniref:Efflux RND transporter permease subunit n=1 Tax=Phytohabitans maris TaxID=3071409 RepID=A0ABU0ZF06_9ACTN|nr:efflux RND transporter permease subunit [Phytohabitans sp. ZYX-F-186]MDQ7905641.1 efflux RND transporter permease subunit [Phytohabitans sp. ZYX-F-186]